LNAMTALKFCLQRSLSFWYLGEQIENGLVGVVVFGGGLNVVGLISMVGGLIIREIVTIVGLTTGGFVTIVGLTTGGFVTIVGLIVPVIIRVCLNTTKTFL